MKKFNRIMVNYTIKPQKSILMLRFKGKLPKLAY